MGLARIRSNEPVRRKAVVARSGAGTVHLNVLSRCRKVYQPAKTFRQLVALVRAAEEKLIESGMTDWEDRVSALRGLYYGTTWSTDYQKEQSNTRNFGFRRYTASPLDPDDVLPVLECNLGRSLQKSQDVHDGKHLLDWGHLIIGLDARRKVLARTWNFSEGGTGLEICTWLGDLGGGAAMLAKDRVKNPAAPAHARMVGSDFGGPINLEGDVAAYVAASSESDGQVAAPSLPDERISDALERYLDVSNPLWKRRAELFLRRAGGKVEGKTISNRDELVAKWAEKIEDFGAFYLLVRLRDQGKLDAGSVHQAARELPPAARQLAELFVGTLVLSMTEDGATLAPQRVPEPPKPQISRSNATLERAAGTLDLGDSAKHWFDNLFR